MSFPTQRGRTAAIRHLALQAPAPVIARMLGYRDETTAQLADDFEHQQAGFAKVLLVDSCVHVSTHDAVASRSSPSPAAPPLWVTEGSRS